MRLKMLKPLLVDSSTAKALVGLKRVGSPLCEEEANAAAASFYKARLILLFHGVPTASNASFTVFIAYVNFGCTSFSYVLLPKTPKPQDLK